MMIAISKGQGDPKYEKYARWLLAADPACELIELSSREKKEALRLMERIDGIIFTGGEDIHPSRYERADAVPLCGIFDEARDEREFLWLERARQRGIPILGVCRGMQLINIAFGGTLFSDIPDSFPDALPHRKKEADEEHPIAIEADSLLSTIADSLYGTVNSFHHQAIDRIAPVLRVTGRSTDGIIEAIEDTKDSGNAFLLGVQWHPERMSYDSPFSGGIARTFIGAMHGDTAE